MQRKGWASPHQIAEVGTLRTVWKRRTVHNRRWRAGHGERPGCPVLLAVRPLKKASASPMGVSMGQTITAAIESIVPPTADKYGDILKIVQIGFYTIAAFVAILTYRAARRGLLNTAYTEYQKRVMDRLQKLSEDLYSEFDPSSETYWPKVRAVHEAIEDINDVFERNRDEILAERKYYYGAPVTKDVERLRRLLDPVISDPFIPDGIRSAVVDLMDNRVRCWGAFILMSSRSTRTIWRRASMSLSLSSMT